MSHGRRRHLGLSSHEYEEGIILERIFQLAHRNRCSTCLIRKPSHVDQDRIELLCETCARRCPYKLHIGHDHISKVLLERLESAYDRRSSRNRIAGHKSDNKKHGSHRRKHSVSSSERGASPRRLEGHTKRNGHSKKRAQSFESVSTDESVQHYPQRSPWPEPRRSMSMSPNGRGRSRPKGVCPLEEDLFAGQHQRYYRVEGRYPGDPVDTGHQTRYMDAPRHEPMINYQQPAYHGTSASMPPPVVQRDPYGYDMTLADDMPGMKGIMMSRPSAPAEDIRRTAEQEHPLMRSGMQSRAYANPPVDPLKGRQLMTAPDYRNGGDRMSKDQLPISRDHNQRFEGYMPPAPRPGASSNPFASSSPRERAPGRLDMTSMRLALPSPDVTSQQEPRLAFDKYQQIPPQQPGVSAYRGLYYRRPRH
ncbi:hypothetical protein BaOVIS_003760 [Babesia ovis]|uniref:Uncharacterized protein n=1 Tax=Babesia ovis TaxID=5869 RepID=A0A9W5T8A3_BABOV|nr:hypothetical protein BaOVIS_003760 [Babesia ovis]